MSFDYLHGCDDSDINTVGFFFRQKVEKRSKSLKIRAMGIYPEATVMRGLNWEGGDKDGELFNAII